MSRLIERAPDDADTLYPVEIPAHVWPRRSGEKTPVSLYFTVPQSLVQWQVSLQTQLGSFAVSSLGGVGCSENVSRVIAQLE